MRRKGIDRARPAVDQSLEDYRLVGARARQGDATPAELTDAETGLTRAQQDYANAIYDYLTALARLEYAMGTAPSAAADRLPRGIGAAGQLRSRARQLRDYQTLQGRMLKENRFPIEHSGTSQRDPQSLVQERCCDHADQRHIARFAAGRACLIACTDSVCTAANRVAARRNCVASSADGSPAFATNVPICTVGHRDRVRAVLAAHSRPSGLASRPGGFSDPGMSHRVLVDLSP